MPACHAGGHEFEPRTHRKETLGILIKGSESFLFTTKSRKKMKTSTLFIIMMFAVQSIFAQDKTYGLTVYEGYKPAIITLADGRKINQPLANVFLKNSSLLYLSSTGATMEANMSNIVSVKFDDRQYIKIDSLLAYQVDTIGHDALYCATVIDMVAYRQNLRNNQVITDISLGDQISTTSVDLSNETDHMFPLINIYIYRLGGKFVRCHERTLGNMLSKEKKRMMRTYMTLPDFSWTDDKSLLKLLKGLQ